MEDQDVKRDDWRQATENLAPGYDFLLNLHAAVDQAALVEPLSSGESGSPASAAQAKAAGSLATSKVAWLIASIVVGIVVSGGLFAWLRNRPVPPASPVAPAVPLELIGGEPVGCEPGVSGSAPPAATSVARSPAGCFLVADPLRPSPLPRAKLPEADDAVPRFSIPLTEAPATAGLENAAGEEPSPAMAIPQVSPRPVKVKPLPPKVSPKPPPR